MKFLEISPAILLVTVFMFSCQQQEDYKKIRTQVVDLHEKVMKDADLAHGQYKALDSVCHIMKNKDSLKVRNMMANIEKSNHAMEEWMEHFEPDVSGKATTESVQYFKAELDKVNKLDHRYKKVIIAADHYLDSLHRIR